ncbi:uncharacterized protein Dere_GG27151, partial [Drosophila erecta]
TVEPTLEEYLDNDAKIEIPKPQDKSFSEPTPLVTPFTSIHDAKPKEVISFKAEESSKTIQKNIMFASTSITTEDTKIVIPIDSLSNLKDDKIPTSLGDKTKSPRESVKPILKEYSDDESDEEFGITKPHDKPDSYPISLVTAVTDSDDEMDIPKPQDKQVSHPTSLVTSVTGSGDKSLLNTAEKSQSPEKKDDKVLAKPEDSSNVIGAEVKSPLQSEEKPKSPEKKDEKVLAKPDDSSKSVIETVKPSPKEYSANEDSDDEMDIPKPQDKQVSHPTSLVTSVTGSGDKSLLHTAEKLQSPEKKDDKVLAKPEDSSKC